MRNLDTPAARKHFLCPKPRPGLRTKFLPAVADWQLLGMSLRLTPPEQRAMAQICQTADLLQTEAGAFLLVPCDAKLLDTLAAFGIARWARRDERGETRPALDLTWAALNSLVLALGTLILRGHIERQLPEPFTTPTQLQRWQDSVNTLLRGDELTRDLGIPRGASESFLARRRADPADAIEIVG